MQENKIRTGIQAEKYVAEELAKRGCWVGNFNKGHTGTQPFDQIMSGKKKVWAYDVKHSKIDRFDFRRVEENQESALGFLYKQGVVNTGFVIVYKDTLYYLSYGTYLTLKKNGDKSVKITELIPFLDLLMYKGEIAYAW